MRLFEFLAGFKFILAGIRILKILVKARIVDYGLTVRF
jgi:hypothetical protein